MCFIPEPGRQTVCEGPAFQDAAEPPGRALDFFCQVLLSEFSTIAPTASYAGIAQTVVEVKTELEEICEQEQNIE